jgi:cytosine permease
LLGYAAAKTSLSTHVLSRYAFGVFGSKLPSFMLALTQIGWFGVGVAMFAYPINKFLGIDNLPLIIGGGIVMTYTVMVGFKAIEWLSIVAVPAILILGVTSVTKAITDTDGGLSTLVQVQPVETITFAVGISLAVGSFISGATLTPDFVRFAKTKRVGVWATIIGFTFGNSLMFIFGAVGATATGLSDISEVLAAQGLLGAGIALLVLNIWTTNDNALYASSLGLRNITGLKRVHLVLAAGVVGTILSEFLYNNFVGWLVFLSVSLPPIGGVIIGDFYLRCKTEYPSPKTHKFKEINWAAMLAWGLAIGVSVMSPSDGVFSIAPLNAIITAVVIYVPAYKVIYAKDYDQTKQTLA